MEIHPVLESAVRTHSPFRANLSMPYRLPFLLALAFPVVPLAGVELDQFAPDPRIIGYSVFTTDSIWLPSNSGLASGGLFGSAGGIALGDGLRLRSPRINAGESFTLGSNTSSQHGVPQTWVGGDFRVGSDATFRDTFQVGGTFVSGANGLRFSKPVAVRGAFDLTGNQLSDSALLRLGSTYNAPSLTFTPSARVEMSAASGGPALPGRVTYNTPWTPLLPAPALPSASTDLPAGKPIVGYAPPATRPDVDLSGPRVVGDAAVQFLSPDTTTAYYWKCSSAGLPAGSCRGDTLLPGYYGNLTVTGNGRALLLTDGFYSFTSIAIGGGNAIIAAQARGTRTVVYSEGNVTASSSHAFLGPDSARMATGFGSGPNQFLGGTMMLASGGNITIPSDNRLWATLSAPFGEVHFSSQVTLFGQVYAKRVIGDNNIDFGEGAFIPFRWIPALQASSLSIRETAASSCSDPSGRPCRDTTLLVTLPAVTAYTVTLDYRILETSPVGATADTDFAALDSGRVVIPVNTLVAAIPVRIFDDSAYEAPESFLVRLFHPHAAAFPDSNGVADTSIQFLDVPVTILDDDLPPEIVLTADSAVREGDTGTRPLTFTVRLQDPITHKPLDPKHAPQVPVSFRWRTLDGLAAPSGTDHARLSDSDYVGVAPRRDTLPFRSTSLSISVAVRGDLRHESDEHFRIRLDSLLGLDSVGSVLLDSGWILNDDAPPTLSIADVSVQEPPVFGASDTAVFRVALSRPSGLAVVVSFTTRDSTARSAIDPVSGIRDYRALAGSLSIPPDSAGVFLRVPVYGDTLHEGPEHFLMRILSSTGASLTDSVAVAAIRDADSAPRLFLDTAWVREPASGTASLVFRARLSAPSGLATSFSWRTDAGSALPGLDYTEVAGRVLPLRAGLRDTTFAVSVLADSIAGEKVESLTVAASNLVGLRTGRTATTGFIVDAQGLPALAIADLPAVVEADSTLRFPVTLDWYPADTVTVPWTTVAGSAPAGIRWVAASGTIRFLPGQRSTSIAVTIRDDLKGQPDPEDFFVALGVPANARYGDSLGRAVLLDDGDEPYARIDDATAVREGDTAVFVVRLLRRTPNTVTIPWSFRAGTAGTADVRTLAGTATFAPGDTLARVRIPTVVDTLWEPTETFGVHLDSCRNCMIRAADSLGAGLLLEEGDSVRLSFASRDTTVREDRAGTVVVRVALSRASSIPLRAVLGTSGSTALRPQDWSLRSPTSDTLRFPAGSRWTELRLPVVPDTLEEPTEFVRLRLAPQSPLASGSVSTWTLTILDDDHRPVLVITRPDDSLRTNRPSHVIDWTLDGARQDTADTLLVEGWNRIVRTHVDSFGHVATDTVHVWADFTAPVVRVFKITGPNPLAPERDTTWWGDRARTRFGRDTIWYTVRDSSLRDDGTWRVRQDTLFAVTDFSGDGLFPTEVKACDDLGNCGRDTGWIDLKQSIPVVEIRDPRTGQAVPSGDIPVNWTVTDGGRAWTNTDTHRVPGPGVDTVRRCWTDDVGNTGCDTTRPVADPVHVAAAIYVDRDGDGRIDAAIVTLDVPWPLDTPPVFDLTLGDSARTDLLPDSAASAALGDPLRLVVPVVPPFAWGLTSVDSAQKGLLHQTFRAPDGVHVSIADTFLLADGAAPVVLRATISRVENYTDPDTLRIVPSEPLRLDAGASWLEVGSCPGSRTRDCDPATASWRRVPAESVFVAADGSLWFLVPPGEPGSIRPGYVVRFLEGVSDTSGNRVDTARATWSTPVTGAPRPDRIEVRPSAEVPVLTTAEQERQAPGGILLRVSRGSNPDGQWWEPGRGYLPETDPLVRSICPDERFCSGPTLYINRPVRLVLYIYDLAGTFAFSRTVDITQKDIDAMEGDRIDRLQVTPSWNFRSVDGRVVGSGVYVWRIVAQLHDDGATSSLQNILWRSGVKVPRN